MKDESILKELEGLSRHSLSEIKILRPDYRALKTSEGINLFLISYYDRLGGLYLALIEEDPSFLDEKYGEDLPIHLAVSRDEKWYHPIIKVRPSHLDAVGLNGLRPLHHAVLSGNHRAVKDLLERGADPDAKDNHGDSPRDLASCGSLLVNPFEDQSSKGVLLRDAVKGTPSLSVISSDLNNVYRESIYPFQFHPRDWEQFCKVISEKDCVKDLMHVGSNEVSILVKPKSVNALSSLIGGVLGLSRSNPSILFTFFEGDDPKMSLIVIDGKLYAEP